MESTVLLRTEWRPPRVAAVGSGGLRGWLRRMRHTFRWSHGRLGRSAGIHDDRRRLGQLGRSLAGIDAWRASFCGADALIQRGMTTAAAPASATTIATINGLLTPAPKDSAEGAESESIPSSRRSIRDTASGGVPVARACAALRGSSGGAGRSRGVVWVPSRLVSQQLRLRRLGHYPLPRFVQTSVCGLQWATDR